MPGLLQTQPLTATGQTSGQIFSTPPSIFGTQNLNQQVPYGNTYTNPATQTVNVANPNGTASPPPIQPITGTTPIHNTPGTAPASTQPWLTGTGMTTNTGQSIVPGVNNTGLINPPTPGTSPGGTSGTPATPGTTTTFGNGTIPDLFQPGLYPTSQSQSQSGSTAFNQGTSNSQSTGLSQGASQGTSYGLNSGNSASYNQGMGVSAGQGFQGLDEQYRNQLMGGIMNPLMQSIAGLNAVPQQYADNASRMYENMSRNAMENSLPGLLNSLASRGVLNSSVASNAISDTMNELIPQFANQGYQAQMQAGQMQMQIPGILGQLAGLGQYNQNTNNSLSTNTGASQAANYGMNTAQNTAYNQAANQSASNANNYGMSNSNSNSYAQTQNPLAPYELLANFLMGY